MIIKTFIVSSLASGASVASEPTLAGNLQQLCTAIDCSVVYGLSSAESSMIALYRHCCEPSTRETAATLISAIPDICRVSGLIYWELGKAAYRYCSEHRVTGPVVQWAGNALHRSVMGEPIHLKLKYQGRSEDVVVYTRNSIRDLQALAKENFAIAAYPSQIIFGFHTTLRNGRDYLRQFPKFHDSTVRLMRGTGDSWQRLATVHIPEGSELEILLS